jgi:hypothetical protein
MRFSIQKGMFAAAAMTALPFMASAQELGTVRNLVAAFRSIVALLIPLLFGLAVVAFFWGVVKYIWKPEERAEGIRIIIAGLVGIFVMASLWGLVSLLGTNLGVPGAGGSVPAPTVNGL